MDITQATPAELAAELLSREDFAGGIVTVELGSGNVPDSATVEYSASVAGFAWWRRAEFLTRAKEKIEKP